MMWGILLEYLYRTLIATALGFLVHYELYPVATGLGAFFLLDEIAGLKEG